MTDGEIRESAMSDGARLRFRHWRATEPRGIVIALHGIQSHSGWYKYSSRRIADNGFDVCFADRRGSGRNGRQRGHAAHGLRLINDVRSLAMQMRQEHWLSSGRRLPVVLLGISWGGKTAAATAGLFPQEFDGLVLLTPGLEPRFRPSIMQTIKLKLARRWEIVRENLPIPLRDPRLFTDSAVWQDFIADDPLALHAVTSSLFNSGRDLDSLIATNLQCIRQPTLLKLAGRDQIIHNQRTLKLVHSFGTDRLTSINWPDACHTLEFEPNRDAIVGDLLNWLSWTVPATTAEATGTLPMRPAALRAVNG